MRQANRAKEERSSAPARVTELTEPQTRQVVPAPALPAAQFEIAKDCISPSHYGALIGDGATPPDAEKFVNRCQDEKSHRDEGWWSAQSRGGGGYRGGGGGGGGGGGYGGGGYRGRGRPRGAPRFDGSGSPQTPSRGLAPSPAVTASPETASRPNPEREVFVTSSSRGGRGGRGSGRRGGGSGVRYDRLPAGPADGVVAAEERPSGHTRGSYRGNGGGGGGGRGGRFSRGSRGGGRGRGRDSRNGGQSGSSGQVSPPSAPVSSPPHVVARPAAVPPAAVLTSEVSIPDPPDSRPPAASSAPAPAPSPAPAPAPAPSSSALAEHSSRPATPSVARNSSDVEKEIILRSQNQQQQLLLQQQQQQQQQQQLLPMMYEGDGGPQPTIPDPPSYSYPPGEVGVYQAGMMPPSQMMYSYPMMPYYDGSMNGYPAPYDYNPYPQFYYYVPPQTMGYPNPGYDSGVVVGGEGAAAPPAAGDGGGGGREEGEELREDE